MPARLVHELPKDPGFPYEPKWDGFRCLAFRDGHEVQLQSRHQRPLGRYFPELVEGLRGLPADRFVADGESVAGQDAGLSGGGPGAVGSPCTRLSSKNMMAAAKALKGATRTLPTSAAIP